MPPGKELALLPDGILLGVVEAALPGFQTAEDCAASCSQALGAGAACDFMAFCGRVVNAISRNGRPGPVCSPRRPGSGTPPPPAAQVLCPPAALQGGCSTQTYGQIEQGECLLLSRNCTLPAGREAAPGVVSGASCQLHCRDTAACKACARCVQIARPSAPACHHPLQASLYTATLPPSWKPSPPF